jgi:hypothetical protein
MQQVSSFQQLCCYLCAITHRHICRVPKVVMLATGTVELYSGSSYNKTGRSEWGQNVFDHCLEDKHFEFQTEHGLILIFRSSAEQFLVNFKAFDIQPFITSPPDTLLDLYRRSSTLLTDEHMQPVRSALRCSAVHLLTNRCCV